MNLKKILLCVMIVPLVFLGTACGSGKAPQFPAKGLIEYQEYMVNMERTFTDGIVVYLHEEGKGAGGYYAIGAPDLEGEHLFITVKGKISGLKIGNIVNIEGKVERIRVKNEQVSYLVEKSREITGKIDKTDPYYGEYAELIEKEIRERVAVMVAVIAAAVAAVAAAGAAH